MATTTSLRFDSQVALQPFTHQKNSAEVAIRHHWSLDPIRNIYYTLFAKTEIKLLVYISSLAPAKTS
jgi:hypothetical protein